MSVVDDVRTALQDLVTPDLRELKARVEALERQLEGLSGRFEAFEEDSEHRFDKVENKVERLDVKIDARFDRLESLLSLSERVARL
jgi:predicted  nucleic acid-binding Zn-ribbon protein